MSEVPPSPRLVKYVAYIRNTGRVPLPISLFDEDWSPVGPQLRTQLIDAGWVWQDHEDLYLTESAPS